MATLFRDSIFQKILAEELSQLGDARQALAPHFDAMTRFLAALPEAKAAHAYAPGKWTVSEVIGHLLDTRLVFLNRLLYISRGEARPLPGFDEGLWVREAGHAALPFAALRDLHQAGAAFASATLASLPAGSFSRSGEANGVLITGEEILRYLIAHETHHLRVLRDRYLAP